MSLLLIVGPKSTLAASHAASWWVCRRNRQTPDRYITLSARRGQRNNDQQPCVTSCRQTSTKFIYPVIA